MTAPGHFHLALLLLLYEVLSLLSDDRSSKEEVGEMNPSAKNKNEQKLKKLLSLLHMVFYEYCIEKGDKNWF